MKTVLIILSLLIGTLIIALFILGGVSRSGKAPGLVEGSLSRCPDKPNCVCSEHKDDVAHYISPVVLPENSTFDPLPILKNTVRDMGGSTQTESDNYLAATFSSATFGFIDDLEIRIDPARKVIHIRSASRVGYNDAGVNRKRTELFKKAYNRMASGTDQPLHATPESGTH